LFFLDGYIFKITSLNGHILKNSGSGGKAARRFLCKEGEEYARERKREERRTTKRKEKIERREN
jgi:hypothetical protein